MRFFKYALLGAFIFPLTARAQTVEPLRLELGGYMKWYAAAADYTHKSADLGKYNRFDVMGDAEIYFTGEAALAEDYKIGLTAQLKAGTEPTDFDDSGEYGLYADTKQGRSWDEVYLMFDTPVGRFFAGNVKNTAYQMAVTAPTVSTLGIEESEFTRLSQSAPMTTIPVYDDIGAKIAYISPTFSGVTAGVSYMPSNNTNGHDATVLKTDENLKDALVATVLYDKEFSHSFLSVSGSYARFAPARGKAGENFAAGLQFGSGNWTLGASYMKALNRGLNNTALPARGKAGVIDGGKTDTLNVGYTYDVGPAAAGVNYIVQTGRNARGDNLRQSMVQTSLKYRLGAGIDVFCDMAYINDNTTGRAHDTLGTALGFDLAF